jgi:hypothetical protein
LAENGYSYFCQYSEAVTSPEHREVFLFNRPS